MDRLLAHSVGSAQIIRNRSPTRLPLVLRAVRKVYRAVPLARRSCSEGGLLDTNLGGKAALVLASPDGAADPPHAQAGRLATLFVPTCKGGEWFLGNDQALTDPQLLRIIDAFLIRVEDLFPARRRFVKLSRNRYERVARLNNIGSAARFPGSSFLWRWTAGRPPLESPPNRPTSW